MKCVHCGKNINGEFRIYLKKPFEEVEGTITENDIEFLHKECEEEFYEMKEQEEIYDIINKRSIDDKYHEEDEMDEFLTSLMNSEVDY